MNANPEPTPKRRSAKRTGLPAAPDGGATTATVTKMTTGSPQPSTSRRQKVRLVRTAHSRSLQRQDGFFVKPDLSDYAPTKMIDSMNTTAQMSAQNMLGDILALCSKHMGHDGIVDDAQMDGGL